MLRRLLGLPQTAPTGTGSHGTTGRDVPRPSSAGVDAETQTVRRIVSQLEAMPPEQARYLAAFSYVLARAADADLSISEEETREMERIVVEQGHLLRCCYLVGSADGTISAEETGTLGQIADELQIDRDRLTDLRREFSDRMSAVQALRRQAAPEG